MFDGDDDGYRLRCSLAVNAAAGHIIMYSQKGVNTHTYCSSATFHPHLLLNVDYHVTHNPLDDAHSPKIIKLHVRLRREIKIR